MLKATLNFILLKGTKMIFECAKTAKLKLHRQKLQEIKPAINPAGPAKQIAVSTETENTPTYFDTVTRQKQTLC